MRVFVLLLLPAVVAGQGPPPREPGALQIRILQSSGPVHILGTRSASALTVTVTDEKGEPVAGAAVSFQLPGSGPGGAFGNGLTSDVAITGPDGRASASGVRWNRTPGTCDIRVTAAKGAARASIVSPHRLLAPVTDSPGGPTGAAMGRGRAKTILIIAGVAAGAVGAGLAWGRRTSAGSSAPASAGVSLSLGAPSITIGGPQ
jgi:hypothetical protein